MEEEFHDNLDIFKASNAKKGSYLKLTKLTPRLVFKQMPIENCKDHYRKKDALTLENDNYV